MCETRSRFTESGQSDRDNQVRLALTWMEKSIHSKCICFFLWWHLQDQNAQKVKKNADLIRHGKTCAHFQRKHLSPSTDRWSYTNKRWLMNISAYLSGLVENRHHKHVTKRDSCLHSTRNPSTNLKYTLFIFVSVLPLLVFHIVCLLLEKCLATQKWGAFCVV